MAFDKRGRFDGFPPPSRPIEVMGGIKAASARGGFGGSWWARRWVAVLESFEIGSRLQRGRTYARRGQVVNIEVGKGLVAAKVQGSRPVPYDVKIKVRVLAPGEWKRVAERLSRQAIFAAKLLAGEMPVEIEKIFSDAGVSLFPQKLSEITTSCSCPDSANPCKHIAAVYYLLGEAFDRDPFLIFRMRGMDREEFSTILGESQAERSLTVEEDAPAAAAEPLTADPEQFWSAALELPDLFEDVTPTRAVAALPRRLGNLPFWRGELPLLRALEPSYENGSRRGEHILLGEKVTKLDNKPA